GGPVARRTERAGVDAGAARPGPVVLLRGGPEAASGCGPCVTSGAAQCYGREASHTFSAPCLSSATSRSPSGLKWTDRTPALKAGSVRINLPVSLSHSFTVPLVSPEATRLPSGLNATTCFSTPRDPCRTTGGLAPSLSRAFTDSVTSAAVSTSQA